MIQALSTLKPINLNCPCNPYCLANSSVGFVFFFSPGDGFCTLPGETILEPDVFLPHSKKKKKKIQIFFHVSIFT